jgi:hypothetical protein
LCLCHVSHDSLLIASPAYHGAVCDQPHQGVRGQQTQAHDDRVFQRLQAVLLLACVDDEQENRGEPRGSGKTVFDGGAVRVQFGRDLVGGDVLVMHGKLVAIEAEGTYPDAGAHIDLAGTCQWQTRHACWLGLPERVEHTLAGRSANNGLVLQQRGVRLLLERRIEGADGHDEARSFLQLWSALPCDISAGGRHTMRELGNVFQLRRMPSRSSTSLHWSFNASKSAIVCWCRGCGQVWRVGWWDSRRPQVELAGRR